MNVREGVGPGVMSWLKWDPYHNYIEVTKGGYLDTVMRPPEVNKLYSFAHSYAKAKAMEKAVDMDTYVIPMMNDTSPERLLSEKEIEVLLQRSKSKTSQYMDEFVKNYLMKLRSGEKADGEESTKMNPGGDSDGDTDRKVFTKTAKEILTGARGAEGDDGSKAPSGGLNVFSDDEDEEEEFPPGGDFGGY